MLVWLFENDRKKEITKQKFGEALINKVIEDRSAEDEYLVGQAIYKYETALAEYNNVKAMVERGSLVDDDTGRTTDEILLSHEEAVKEYKNRLYDAMWSQFVDVDPTPEKQCKYVPWIVNRYLNGGIALWEDLSRTKTALEAHYDMVTRRVFQNMPDDNKFKPYGDINRFKSLNDVEIMLREIMSSGTDLNEATKKFLANVQKYSSNGGVTVIWKSADNLSHVMKLNTVEASTALFAQKTSWCTAPQGNSYFAGYSRQGPLYTFTNLADDWYFQLHPESRQFMDKDDYRATVETSNIPIEMWRAYVSVKYGDMDTTDFSDSLTMIIANSLVNNTSIIQAVNNAHRNLPTEEVSSLIKKLSSSYYLSKVPDASEETLNNTDYMLDILNLREDETISRRIDVAVRYTKYPPFMEYVRREHIRTLSLPDDYQFENDDVMCISWYSLAINDVEQYIRSLIKLYQKYGKERQRDYVEIATRVWDAEILPKFGTDLDNELKLLHLEYAVMKVIEPSEFNDKADQVGIDESVSLGLKNYEISQRAIQLYGITVYLEQPIKDINFANHMIEFLSKKYQYNEDFRKSQEFMGDFYDHPDMIAIARDNLETSGISMELTDNDIMSLFVVVIGIRDASSLKDDNIELYNAVTEPLIKGILNELSLIPNNDTYYAYEEYDPHSYSDIASDMGIDALERAVKIIDDGYYDDGSYSVDDNFQYHDNVFTNATINNQDVDIIPFLKREIINNFKEEYIDEHMDEDDDLTFESMVDETDSTIISFCYEHNVAGFEEAANDSMRYAHESVQYSAVVEWFYDAIREDVEFEFDTYTDAGTISVNGSLMAMDSKGNIREISRGHPENGDIKWVYIISKREIHDALFISENVVNVISAPAGDEIAISYNGRIYNGSDDIDVDGDYGDEDVRAHWNDKVWEMDWSEGNDPTKTRKGNT